MATTTAIPTDRVVADAPEPSNSFESVMLAASLWFIIGVFTDGWAHNHLDGIESFFTPWHAVLYSGYVATAVTIAGMTLRNASHGLPLLRAIPRGYEISAAGAIVFAVAGALDMTWHLAFGVEQDFAALLSPTHLLLATGAVMMASGPLCTALRRGRLSAPALVSLTLIVSVLAFFTQFTYAVAFSSATSPYRASFWSGLSTIQREGQANIFLQWSVGNIVIRAALFSGALLFVLRNFTPRFGTFTALYGVSWGLMTLMIAAPNWRLVWLQIVSALAAGLLADYLVTRHVNVRVVAFAVPFAWFALLLALVAYDDGTWWVIHISTGAVVYAGVTGLLLSYLAFPPGISAGGATSARL